MSNIEEMFDRYARQDERMSRGVIATMLLLDIVKRSDATTMAQLQFELTGVVNRLKVHDISPYIASSCELFLRFIGLNAFQYSEFHECKRVLTERGARYIRNAMDAKNVIGRLSHTFVREGSVVLIHSQSDAVIELLREAKGASKNFKVYVTESHPWKDGYEVKKLLDRMNISCTVILDNAVGFIIDEIDIVILGAEAVIENGGIINRLGSNQIAVLAHYNKKPVYVAAESFKFYRAYPLNKYEIPNEAYYKVGDEELDCKDINRHPTRDYTPPEFITLLLTDLGILSPIAVSEELIKIYL